MARKAQLRAALTLDNSQFARGIKQSIQFAKDLGKQFKAAPIKTTFLAGVLTARQGVKGLASAVEGFAKASVRAFKISAVTAAALAVSLAGISYKAIQAAAQIEQFETSFRVFLGSATAARDRMKELVNFAAHTPFQLPQVAEASKTLEVLTQGALSTGKGLEMVGDIASATNRDFQETAVTVGRLFAALRGGQHPGEALASLQDAGAISPQARRQIEGAAGISGAKAWQMAQKELSRFNGMMKQQSLTWNGLMSTFHDSILTALSAFGKPLIRELKPALDDATQFIFSAAPRIEAMGEKFAAGIKLGIGVLEEALLNPEKLVIPLQLGLSAAAHEMLNVLVNGIKLAASLAPTIVDAIEGGFVGLQMVISGSLMKAFQGPIAFLLAGFEKAMAMAKALTPMGLKDSIAANMKANTAQGRVDREVGVEGDLVDSRRKAKKEGGDVAKWDKRIKHQQLIIQQAEAERADAQREADKLNPATSVGDRAKAMSVRGELGEAGDAQTKQGQEILTKQLGETMTKIAKVIREFQPQDVAGAGDAMKKFLDALKALAAQGQKDASQAAAAAKAKNAALTDSSAEAAKAAAQRSAVLNKTLSPLGDAGDLDVGRKGTTLSDGLPFRGEGGRWAPGSVLPLSDFIAGKTASSLDMPAQRTVSSLLPLRERRATEQAIRGAEIGQHFLDTHEWSMGGSMGRIRKGDMAAARAFVQEKQRTQQEQDKNNGIAKAMKDAFDEGMAKFWGDGAAK